MLQLQTFGWTGSHFTMIIDIFRVVIVPSTPDARTDLASLVIKSSEDVENSRYR